jgi:hypothetical protein
MPGHQRDKQYQHDEAYQPEPVTAAFIVCPWCGHGDNPITASFCEICSRSLVEENVSRKPSSPSQPNLISSNYLLGLGVFIRLNRK